MRWRDWVAVRRCRTKSPQFCSRLVIVRATNGRPYAIFVVCSLFAFSAAQAQETVGISVDVEPPPLPVYDQPPIPVPGYLLVPGYWAWDGYCRRSLSCCGRPDIGAGATASISLTTGYWEPQIGFYGGVAYGLGYTGDGYEGGYWRNGAFFCNQSVNNISNVSITNVYNKTIVVNNTSNVSYNGGTGGTTAKPTPEQLAAEKERHAEQTHNVQAAAKDPTLSLNNNHGPTVAATAHPAQFKGPGVVAAHPGKPVAAVQPQGHRVVGPGNAATTPGNKTGPAITTPGTKVGPAATTPSAKVGPEIREHKGTGRRWPTAPQASRPTPPPPQASRPTPPPPRAADIRHLRRAPPRRCRRGRQHQPSSPSASRVHTAKVAKVCATS